MPGSTLYPDAEVGPLPAGSVDADDRPPSEAQGLGRGHPRRPVRVVVRQRRVVTSLFAVTVVAAGIAATTPLQALWVVAGFAVALTAAYLGLVAHIRRLAVEREMTLAFGSGLDIDAAAWGALDRELALAAADNEDPYLEATTESAAVVRFVLASMLGWALTPVVALIRLSRGDLSDLRRRGVLERLVRAQEYGRSQSLRVFTVSVAATAGVAGVGMASAGVAGAAPAIAASARMTTAAPSTSSYTVQVGDTLSAIAARYGMALPALASINHITNLNLITVGHVLAVTGSPSGSGTYTVKVGDTLGSIAARYGTTVAALAAANHLADPNVITVGQALRVGGASSVTTAAATTPLSGSGTYTVKVGDTLGSIAARHATTVAALAAANHLADPNVITVGRTLQVGGGSAAPTISGGAPAPAAAAAPAPAATAPAAPPAPAPAPAAPAATGAAKAVATALAQVGVPYVYGGSSPSGFDCSGLVMYAWASAGVSLPHYTVSQYQSTTRVSSDQLQPGDLVFYGGSEPGHDTMYIGNGQVITADHTGTLIKVVSIDWDGTPTGYGRVG